MGGKNGANSTSSKANGHSMFSKEYTQGWREFTGGYNKKSMISVAVCLVSCVTPLWPLPLLPLIPALIWFIIDTLIKVLKYNKHLKDIRNSNSFDISIKKGISN
ncbi:hypothetical protein [Desulfosporosinus sp. SB140]|uniref:hypothetical protein n=1 Tax=Desulfosporosinus paludis TaxID=3115649 RepID=UPI00388E5202